MNYHLVVELVAEFTTDPLEKITYLYFIFYNPHETNQLQQQTDKARAVSSMDPPPNHFFFIFELLPVAEYVDVNPG